MAELADTTRFAFIFYTRADFAEQLTMRKRALTTQEVADAVVYLLSPRSSGINAQGIVVNAGMDWNYFDETVVERVMRGTNTPAEDPS